jgi:hypothetical protein
VQFISILCFLADPFLVVSGVSRTILLQPFEKLCGRPFKLRSVGPLQQERNQTPINLVQAARQTSVFGVADKFVLHNPFQTQVGARSLAVYAVNDS